MFCASVKASRSIVLRIFNEFHVISSRTIVATSGSDYKPFYHTLGISCVDLRYMFSKVSKKAVPMSCTHSLGYFNSGWRRIMSNLNINMPA